MNKSDRDLGNECFKSGNYSEALNFYMKGLSVKPLDSTEKLNLLKNQAMCYMKLENYEAAIEASSKALELNNVDEKSLFRRSQAYIKLDNFKDAFTDAKTLLHLDPKNKLYQSNLKEIQQVLQEKVDKVQSYKGKVDIMYDTLTEAKSDEDKIKCLNNLTVLSRESRGDSYVWKHESMEILFNLCKPDVSSVKVIEAAQRCLSSISLDSIDKSLEIFLKHGPQYFADLIYSRSPEHCRLAGIYLESLLSGLTQIKAYKESKNKYYEEQKLICGKLHPNPYPKYKLDDKVEKYVTECFMTLIRAVNSKKLTGSGRDSILEIMLRFIPSKEGIDWSRTFLKVEGALLRLLEVGAASHRNEIRSEDLANKVSLISTTEKTKMTVAILLAQLYDDLISDQEREKYRDICCNFILDLFSDEIFESKVEAANLIGLLFQGPFEVGNAMLSRSGVLESILLLLKCDVLSYQRIALDTVVQAVTKKDKCMSVVKNAAPLLEEVYRNKSNEPEMRVRALVGLCKLGVAGGRDASPSVQGLAEGSTLELAKCCKRLLLESSTTDKQKNREVHKWAAEGLAFLTLDAEVKELVVEDTAVLSVLLNINEDWNMDCLYPMATLLVNITNSYEKPDVLPELIELAKYSKQHVPETHEKDGEQFVKGRVNQLMKMGLPNTLYNLSQLSENSPGGPGAQEASRELLARAYLAAATIETNRGQLVQAGCGKVLISLALKNSEVGKSIAAQALAKVAITMNPKVAFPGQRSLEVIRPIMCLLHVENEGLQNFEALLALTNLASMDDSHRKRIFEERGLSKIEHYVYEDHWDLRRAATECICNLVKLAEIREKFYEPNDRIKTLVLYSAELEDAGLIKAASGALAILSDDKRIVDKVSKVKNWFEIIQTLVASEDGGIRHRGIYILTNMIKNGSEDFCRFIAESNMLEVLMALSKLSDIDPNVAEFANAALNHLVELKLIQPNRSQ